MNCHYVTTADGYILRLYHIPTPAQNTSNNALKPPMLFMHGLQASSLDYVFYPNASAGECALGQSYFDKFIDHINLFVVEKERRCHRLHQERKREKIHVSLLNLLTLCIHNAHTNIQSRIEPSTYVL